MNDPNPCPKCGTQPIIDKADDPSMPELFMMRCPNWCIVTPPNEDVYMVEVVWRQLTEGNAIMDDDWTFIRFPEHYRPLPVGYEVVWGEPSQCYYWVKDLKYDGAGKLVDYKEGPETCDRFQARRMAFANAPLSLAKLLYEHDNFMNGDWTPLPLDAFGKREKEEGCPSCRRAAEHGRRNDW